MTKQQKLLAKLLRVPPPKDLTWSELETILKSLGFVFQSTTGGGSHGKFVYQKDPTLYFSTCRPHPRPTIGSGTIRNLVMWLSDNQFI